MSIKYNLIQELPEKSHIRITDIKLLFNFMMVYFRYESQLEGLRQQSFNMEQANFTTQTLKDTKITVSSSIFMNACAEHQQLDAEKVNCVIRLQEDFIYHLFTGTEGNSMFCGPETVDVFLSEAEFFGIAFFQLVGL